ncbi:2-keto-4-pentenoate hydratase/2-oxohepta-3-ene-1,7-dioic acid hydratase (catechol pathway) [Marisediminitalea aggregata]|jgi:2-keto-4-pentenoate hydratase/2-oxohepta-3-ene-1,7-dioic acid hydratase in catechol pathway|uniref:2-keto-4-pentenoate hydratase/2-oxohepta-3-ene-1,7-dioic acid hydratase (Catechol pathway) n=1 Tax=Marisediminitalea aggregata TaxID=634436 RepID=A0A1M5NB01_9ALTE|nr:fumarylacetoacetate hydrolase family protein [Marisediminitalea aggregata]BBO25764.1 5-carboxymethyl-2-hydroxymuconate isomerase [Alteromonas sp. I4]SHG86710.1 2-keto-4-pentenoate hydratase/2-oxohepta-3-ene-1,7-dioic acid hydratase (catechol pathway) [Marisediminitalea aggregata]
MKYVSFTLSDGSAGFGRLHGDTIEVLSSHAADLKAAIDAGTLATLGSEEQLALDSVTLAPVIPNPGKVFCVGHNYETHRQETGRAATEYPSIFVRFADSLGAHNQPIVMPKVSTDLDYEGELAVIIGKGGRYISEEDAMSHVAGYACFNDASVRDWQWHSRQFTPGKNFPTTGPFGPFMVTPDEAGDLSEVNVTTKLNDQIVQQQPIGDMIFPIATVIAYISSFTPLKPGDVIASGTPGGVGAKRTPPLWMKPGDTVTVEIGPMGTLSNTIVAE